MPMSLSSDQGKTWTYRASPFPPIASGQRLVLKRLHSNALHAVDPLLLVSFTSGKNKQPEANGMEFVDQQGRTFTGHGMYAAVSFDDGETWPIRKLLFKCSLLFQALSFSSKDRQCTLCSSLFQVLFQGQAMHSMPAVVPTVLLSRTGNALQKGPSSLQRQAKDETRARDRQRLAFEDRQRTRK